ncbi:MAG: Sec-independent protein translocase protein TatB [Pseudomonadota bacterium]
MFDIGWLELMLIGIVALIVVGPKDLPGMFRTVGQYVGQARRMAREFQRSMEQAADAADVTKDLRKATQPLQSLNRMTLDSATDTARKYASSVAEKKLTEPAEPAADSESKPAASSSDEGTRAPSTGA